MNTTSIHVSSTVFAKIILISTVLLFLISVRPAQASTFTWDGKWSTGSKVWGDMYLSGDISGFSGTYTWDSGKVTATRTPDNGTHSYSGWWSESPSYAAPKDAGEVTIVLESSLRSFTGNWRYDRSGSWHSFSGSCVEGACLGNTSIASDEPADWKLQNPLVTLKSVSNGCGGEGLPAAVRNWGNTSRYRNSILGPTFLVNFKPSCDIHDAAYSGAKVKNPLRKYAEVDYFLWPQSKIDAQFLTDMRSACANRIPASYTNARKSCYSRGDTFSFGAKWRYDLVRDLGHKWYIPRPALTGTWKTVDGTPWSITQSGRSFTANWSSGNRSAKVKGVIISKGKNYIISGFDKVLTDTSWDMGSMAITWNPKQPNKLVVSSLGYNGSLTR